MKILVTGATGKVGSRLSKRLAERGDDIRALVRDTAKAVELSQAKIELAKGDLLDQDSLAAAVRGVDAVVHCAAFFRGATPEEAQATNDLGTQHLARAAAAANVKRFVFTSTNLVYGATGGRVVNEDDACAPVTELVPPAVATAGQEMVNPAALPLDSYLDEITELISQSPTPNEIVVQAAQRLRWAERDGTYAELLKARSHPLNSLAGR